MPYVRRQRRDSAPVLAPLLLAIGSLGLLSLFWRRRAAPRTEHRRARTGAPEPRAAAPPKTGETEAGSDAQLASSGAGALVHRRYEVELPLIGLQPEDLLRLMQRHLTELAPSALANFTKTAGSEQSFRIGDEYDITMLGPWNGRVRVTELSDAAFTLLTLNGHPEAGHITFSATKQPGNDEAATLLIESWARARDAFVNAAYSTMRIGKQVQAEVWITFLQRLAALAGVTETPQVRITTEERSIAEPVTEPDGQ
jgi:Domain of unknown function (DUF1990)